MCPGRARPGETAGDGPADGEVAEGVTAEGDAAAGVVAVGLSHYWWGWVFLMNVPVVVIGLAAVTALVPESRAAQVSGLDPAGIVTSCAGLGVLIYGFIAAGQYGSTSATALIAMAAGAALLVAFVGCLRRPARPPRVRGG